MKNEKINNLKKAAILLEQAYEKLNSAQCVLGTMFEINEHSDFINSEVYKVYIMGPQSLVWKQQKALDELIKIETNK